ncbi:MAG: hypothetical protein ACREFE_08985 [Limisphaerales bacterium]
MTTRDAGNFETHPVKDAILLEIFIAYQEAGRVYQKAASPEIRQTILDLKRCFDFAIRQLSPLGDHFEERWENLRPQFPN